jgi:predicted Zn-dependent peptidase
MLLAGRRRTTQTAGVATMGSSIRQRLCALLALGLMASLGPRSAAASGEPEAALAEFGRTLAARIEKCTLPNGLRLVMNVEHRSPTVGVCATYAVGTRDQASGEVGFAGLLERWVETELEPIIWGRGGELDLAVEDDRSVVCAAVPNHELDVAVWATTIWLRRLAPEGTERTPARHRDLGTSADWERLRAVVLGDDHALPTGPAAAQAMVAFQQKWYRPDRTILSVAGDFDADRLVEILSSELGPRPATNPAPGHSPIEPTAPPSPRFVSLERAGLRAPVAYLGWQVPAQSSADYPRLELLADLLAGDASSLLGQQLVGGARLAEAVRARMTRSRGPNVLGLEIELAPSASPERVERAVAAVLAQLATDGPTPADWARAGAFAWRRKLERWENSRLRAAWLGAVELERGDPREVSRELDSHARLDRAQARAAVGRYLRFEKRSVLWLRPTAVRARSADPDR